MVPVKLPAIGCAAFGPSKRMSWPAAVSVRTSVFVNPRLSYSLIVESAARSSNCDNSASILRRRRKRKLTVQFTLLVVRGTSAAPATRETEHQVIK